MWLLLLWLTSLIATGVWITQPLWWLELLFAVEMRLPKVVEEL